MLCATVATAHDFEVGGIYYNILSEKDKTVAVTSNEYSGSVVIPETVTMSESSTNTFDAWTSTNKNNSTTSATSYTLNVEAGNILKFDWSVSSEDGFDWLIITLDGTDIVKKSGTLSGSYEKTFDTAGSHYLVVRYIKDHSQSSGNDEGKIYNVTLDIEYRVTSIGDRAFSGCSGLTSIVIPNSVTSIGKEAFLRCNNLTSVELPSSLTIIEEGAFSRTGLNEVTIPEGVTSLGKWAFDNSPALSKVSLPTTLTSIGENAFENCTGLTSITIPNSVTSIGRDAFYGCTGLKAVINFSNLTFIKGLSSDGYIAYYANKVFNVPNGFIDGDFVWFEYENGMILAGYLGDATELTLPADYNGKRVTIIGRDAFYGCTGFTSIEIPNSVTSIGWGAFYECTGLTSITIPNSVTSIGGSTFYGCTGLTSIIIPNSVTFIGKSAFSSCSSVETLYIGNSIEIIEDFVFWFCEKIKEIKIGLDKPIECNSNIFTPAVYNNATLYIPNGTKSLYEKEEPWNLFLDINELDLTGVEEVKAENGNVKAIYDLQGRRVDTLNKGLYIIDGKKVLVK